jgi:hypothetical protein
LGVRASRVSYCFEVTDEAFGEPVGVLAGEVVAAGKDMLVRIGVKRHVTDGLSHASDLELDCGRVRQIERATPRAIATSFPPGTVAHLTRTPTDSETGIRSPRAAG